MQISNTHTFLDYLYHWEQTKPEEIYLKQPFGDSFRDFTWKETGRQVRCLAAYLKSLNLPEKSNIGLVSKNCAEWIIADLAILMAGHVSVPFYPTLIAHQINQVLVHSGCKVLFVGKLDIWEEMKGGIPKDVSCISFPTYNPDPKHVQWEDILEKHAPLKENYSPKLDDLMSIMYTSGTTGNPKGVMADYRAFAEVIYNTRDRTSLDIPNARFFSYLPLCHIAERNLVENASLVTGGTVYFAESLDTFAANLQKAAPTHFLAVPRIWTKFQLGILNKLPQKKLNLLLKIPIVNGLIKKKIKSGLGLSEAIVTLTGAAPMPTSLIKWFRQFGIEIREAYGMTENMGAVSMMPGGDFVDGTVGKLYVNSEVKILEETGEILTKSPWNMLGYYKEKDLTDSTIDGDGWIHTGDVGELDTRGFLKITGRVKEMYKTAKGEYVAPAQIEFEFSDNTNIEQICVVGQSLPQPIALVVLSESGKLMNEKDMIENLRNELNTINPKLKSYEKINKIVVMKEDWTVENNLLTPTLKIKRNMIEKSFSDKFEEWYETDGKVLVLE